MTKTEKNNGEEDRKNNWQPGDEIRREVKKWIKDILEVLIVIAVIVVILKIWLGANTLIPLVAVTSNSMLHMDDTWVNWFKERDIDSSGFPFQSGFERGDMILIASPKDAKVGDVIIYERDNFPRDNKERDPIIHRIVGIVHINKGQVESVEGNLSPFNAEDFSAYYLPHIEECQKGNKCYYVQYPDGETFNFYITKGDSKTNYCTDQSLYVCQTGSCTCRSPLIVGSLGGSISLPPTDSQLVAKSIFVIPKMGYISLYKNVVIVLIVVFIIVQLWWEKKEERKKTNES